MSVNDTATSSQIGTHTAQGGSPSVRYVLFNKHGAEICRDSSSAALVQTAKRLWPDEDSGNGDDIPGWRIEFDDGGIIYQRAERGPVQVVGS